MLRDFYIANFWVLFTVMNILLALSFTIIQAVLCFSTKKKLLKLIPIIPITLVFFICLFLTLYILVFASDQLIALAAPLYGIINFFAMCVGAGFGWLTYVLVKMFTKHKDKNNHVETIETI